MMKPIALLLALVATPAIGAGTKPLFADDTMLHLTIDGPIKAVVASADMKNAPAQAATIGVADTGETLAVALSPRGITRRRSETCAFPPIRVQFTTKPPATSIFAGQKRLKLVTHCRNDPSFQKYPLTEYSVYRLYNLLTPLSFRARLAQIEYRDHGRPMMTRVGFFLEDISDVAKRNHLKEVKAGERLPFEQLDAAAAGQVTMFEYAISNLDWSLVAGPRGSACCHNSKPIATDGRAASIVPVPYDWDYSGFVNAPYAVTPDGFDVNQPVTQRVYRGYCAHNAQAAAAARAMRGRQAEMLAVIASTPGLDPAAARRAQTYLGTFFAQIATEDGIQKILAHCLR